MHNNFYFLRQLSKALAGVLANTVVSECYSQNKDELIIRFETTGDPFFINASLLPSFSCLSFPATLYRAKKNSVDLFQNLIGERVTGIRQFNNERSFAIHFTHDLTLLFKMHGNRANIILFEKTVPTDLFKKNIVADGDLQLHSLNREIDWSYENFLAHRDNPSKIYFTLGKLAWKYLDTFTFKIKTAEEQWTLLQHTLQILDQPKFYITTLDQVIHLSLFPIGAVQKEFTNPILAIQEFHSFQSRDQAFFQEKQAALSSLRSKLNASKSYYQKTLQKLEELKTDNNYKVWADLIMANLHSLKQGSDRITLDNFYANNEPAEIKLKRNLSPQKNAELFYKKSKNQQIEVEHVQKLLSNKAQEITSLQEKIDLLDAAEDLKSVRRWSVDFQKDLTPAKQSPSLPYHDFEYHGFKIWVGRNAQCNDTLTLKYSYKEDLWLHAKDVAGSHVLLKHQAGKNFPKDVIERAAQLAAYHSKRKHETLCPVIVTQKKFVRKRKGDPAGAVVVEREEVILVEPRLH